MKEQERFPLFAFATYEELSGVFPETACSLGRDLILDKVIRLTEIDDVRGFACVAGVGMLDFAVGLSRALDLCRTDKVPVSYVVNLGICGAYPNRDVDVLDTVRVCSDCLGDIGVQESDGSFTPWKKVYSEKLPSYIPGFVKNLKQVKGLTVNGCTGHELTAKFRVETFSCDVESMEGAACFAVCEKFDVPAIQIRAVSNIASTRDKSAWRIAEALEKLRLLFV